LKGRNGPAKRKVLCSGAAALLVAATLLAGCGRPKSAPKATSVPARPARPATQGEAKRALRRALDFYLTLQDSGEWKIGGGWVRRYSADLRTRLGEYKPVKPGFVLIQDPGTPAVGTAFLQGWLLLGERRYLEAAERAGEMLLGGQLKNGGWHYELWLTAEGPKPVHVGEGGTEPDYAPRTRAEGVLDDAVTHHAAEFLYRLYVVTREERFLKGYLRTMEFFLSAQYPDGGFPQMLPGRGYHAYYTLNDGATLNSFQMLLDAYRRTGRQRYRDAAIRCADWCLKAQLKCGGWAEQYDMDMRPARARSFEPPSVSPDTTSDAVAVLGEAWRWTGKEKYRQAVPRAVEWLERARLKDGPEKGLWARFYDVETNRPLFSRRDGTPVESFREAKPGFCWIGRWGEPAIRECARLLGESRVPPHVPLDGVTPAAAAVVFPADDPRKFRKTIRHIIETMDERGAWVVSRGTKIQTKHFVSHTAQLVRFIRGERGDKPVPVIPEDYTPEGFIELLKRGLIPGAAPEASPEPRSKLSPTFPKPSRK